MEYSFPESLRAGTTGRQTDAVSKGRGAFQGSPPCGHLKQVDLGNMILLRTETLWGHLKWPKTQKVSFQGRQSETKVFLTFYETFLQICSRHSRGPRGWRSWTGAGLPGLCTTAWRPATAKGSECYQGRRLSANPSAWALERQDSVPKGHGGTLRWEPQVPRTDRRQARKWHHHNLGSYLRLSVSHEEGKIPDLQTVKTF